MPARARHTDPSSSHAAANAILSHLNHQQAQAVAAVKAFPGRTSYELAQECGQDRYTLARRLPECADMGRVSAGAIRKDRYTGRAGVTWWPA